MVKVLKLTIKITRDQTMAIKRFIKRYPVLTFFVLTTVLGWAAVAVGVTWMPIDAEHPMTPIHGVLVFPFRQSQRDWYCVDLYHRWSRWVTRVDIPGEAMACSY